MAQKLTLTRDFYTNENDTGKYAKVKSEQQPDGAWKWMDYDSEGRETIRIEPWLDSPMGTPAAQAKATYFTYTPVDPDDSLLDYDLRPRTKTVKILNTVPKRPTSPT